MRRENISLCSLVEQRTMNVSSGFEVKLKICHNFQVIASYFSGVHDLFDEHE